MYSFYFGSLLLPVTPQKLTTKIKGNNKTLTLVNEDDINFLRSPGLTEISFDVVLPTLGQYSFAGTFRRPDYYLGIFENYMTSTVDSPHHEARRKDFNQAIFDADKGFACFNGMDLDMVLEKFDAAVRDLTTYQKR